ncbi:MAG: hypothetical protein F4194_09485, partial [Acidimicrobiia bacterium]|nr:hypothetical protein [Acidimicrobiia bacterium]
MARVRIYQIARELDLSSHDVIRQATEIGLAVRAASSTISTEEAELVRFALVGEPETDPEPAPAPEPEPEPVEEASAPSEPVEAPPIAEAE